MDLRTALPALFGGKSAVTADFEWSLADFSWDESKHPRGQPTNKGQFASGPGGGPGSGGASGPSDSPDDAPNDLPSPGPTGDWLDELGDWLEDGDYTVAPPEAPDDGDDVIEDYATARAEKALAEHFTPSDVDATAEDFVRRWAGDDVDAYYRSALEDAGSVFELRQKLRDAAWLLHDMASEEADPEELAKTWRYLRVWQYVATEAWARASSEDADSLAASLSDLETTVRYEMEKHAEELAEEVNGLEDEDEREGEAAEFNRELQAGGSDFRLLRDEDGEYFVADDWSSEEEDAWQEEPPWQPDEQMKDEWLADFTRLPARRVLRITGPAAALADLQRCLDSADFGWVQRPVTSRKSPSPNRYVSTGPRPKAGTVRYFKTPPKGVEKGEQPAGPPAEQPADDVTPPVQPPAQPPQPAEEKKSAMADLEAKLAEREARIAELEARLAELEARLGERAEPAPKPESKDEKPAPPKPRSEDKAPKPKAPDLQEKIKEAYEELRLFKEFRDGMVEIPRLYHEAARRVPGLTVEQFHSELEALNKERKIELHKLNEVRTAKEPGLAIERDDRLYYYVLWGDEQPAPPKPRSEDEAPKPKAPPAPRGPKAAGAVEDASKKVLDLWRSAINPSTTVEQIEAGVRALGDLNPSKAQLEAVAKEMGILRPLDKSSILREVRQRIITRKGAYERPDA